MDDVKPHGAPASTGAGALWSWAFDLDGVLWRGRQPIAGSVEAVKRVMATGAPVAFVTNNSYATVAAQQSKLAGIGLDVEGRVISSAMAAASLLQAGERVFVLGGPGVVEAVEARDAVVVPADTVRDGSATVESVIVGLDRELSYERLSAAVVAARSGARLIATNLDPTYPTENGFLPGGGSIVAAVERATDQTALVAGKPHEPQAELVRAMLGSDGIMVGDRPDTDGAFARTMGYRFGLVLTGVTASSDLPVNPEPTTVADDLDHLVTRLLKPAVDDLG